MELFRTAKIVRLKSHHNKYLLADSTTPDSTLIYQDRNGSTPTALWSVELTPDSTAIRLKSPSRNRYLTATTDLLFFGMTGRKVLQTHPNPLDSSLEWEPVRGGRQGLKLKPRSGSFLRANAGVAPCKKSITHDIPYRTATQDWVLWDVEVVEIREEEEEEFVLTLSSPDLTPEMMSPRIDGGELLPRVARSGSRSLPVSPKTSGKEIIKSGSLFISSKGRDKRPVNFLIIGRPILLALEDIDGSPSFLEKALRFIEDYGIKVEGILRQSADVEEVERRIQQYEQGKLEFSSDEDAHVIGDCIKHVLRELPSSPVPASCCTALVDAYRTDRASRVNAMRAVICETFPEPNRRLVQRILKMMHIVASHKAENRMNPPALAACMAPLLLCPLLAGDCEFKDDFNMGGDDSIQLLMAATAANYARDIVIFLLEEYESIFDDGSSSKLEDGDIEDDGSTDNDIMEDDGFHDAQNDLDLDIEDDLNHSSSGTLTGSSSDVGSDLYENKGIEDHVTGSSSPRDTKDDESGRTSSRTSDEDISQTPSSQPNIQLTQDTDVLKSGVLQDENNNSVVDPDHVAHKYIGEVHTSMGQIQVSSSHILSSSKAKFTEKSNEPVPCIRRQTKWGQTSARNNLSIESIDFSSDDEIVIQRLETAKRDLKTKIAKEVKGNALLQASLERRKEALHERRLALEKDVKRLREQLQRERDLKVSLESGLMKMSRGHLPITSSMDSKDPLSSVIFENFQAQSQYVPSSKNKRTSQKSPSEPTRQTTLSECSGSLSTESSATRTISLPNKFSTMHETALSPADHGDMKTGTQNYLYETDPHQRWQKSMTNQENTMPLRSSIISHTKLSTVVSHFSDNSNSRGKNVTSGRDRDW